MHKMIRSVNWNLPTPLALLEFIEYILLNIAFFNKSNNLSVIRWGTCLCAHTDRVLTLRDVEGREGGAGGHAEASCFTLLRALILCSVRQLWSWRSSPCWETAQCLLPLPICLSCVLFGAGIGTSGAGWALGAIGGGGRSGPAQAA